MPDGHGARALPPCSWLSATEPAGSLPNFLSSLLRIEQVLPVRLERREELAEHEVGLAHRREAGRDLVAVRLEAKMMRRGVIAAWARAARGRIASRNGSASATPEAPRSSVRREMRFGAGVLIGFMASPPGRGRRLFS